MIQSVDLARAGMKSSRLAFGTSRLHYIGKKSRQALLGAAADFGIVHFDSAPCYGDGLAETELGEFARGRRDGLLIATKYGIPADITIESLPRLAFPLRAARSLARRFGRWQDPVLPMTALGLRDSLQRSLRRLRLEFIDILFLHDPTPARIGNADEILEELCRLRDRGLIRAFGLAGGWEGVEGLMRLAPELGLVIQTAEDEWPPECPPDISYGAIARSPQSFMAQGVEADVALQRLRSALSRRKRGVVLISTNRIEKLRMLAEAAQD